MEKLRFNIIQTDWGFVAAAISKHGLRHLLLPKETKEKAFESLCAKVKDEKLVPDNKDLILKKLTGQLKNYFMGRLVEFTYKLDYNTATIFQRQVWCVTRTIPYGATQTYGWIAEKIGDPESKRAVGQALNANPIPILVPCHRVIAARGRLGGFGGGTEMKSRLLKLEGTILA
ncbi:methylated-DNA--[protein]-cysteine S-methyltransferase [bacterium]|nr:methylated-DNA--[protein]-cysteine S-methyltransferase [bacterium]